MKTPFQRIVYQRFGLAMERRPDFKERRGRMVADDKLVLSLLDVNGEPAGKPVVVPRTYGKSLEWYYTRAKEGRGAGYLGKAMFLLACQAEQLARSEAPW